MSSSRYICALPPRCATVLCLGFPPPPALLFLFFPPGRRRPAVVAEEILFFRPTTLEVRHRQEYSVCPKHHREASIEKAADQAQTHEKTERETALARTRMMKKWKWKRFQMKTISNEKLENGENEKPRTWKYWKRPKNKREVNYFATVPKWTRLDWPKLTDTCRLYYYNFFPCWNSTQQNQRISRGICFLVPASPACRWASRSRLRRWPVSVWQHSGRFHEAIPCGTWRSTVLDLVGKESPSPHPIQPKHKRQYSVVAANQLSMMSMVSPVKTE